eukprot:1527259-Lingulodinium_polyedra.AAC.1
MGFKPVVSTLGSSLGWYSRLRTPNQSSLVCSGLWSGLVCSARACSCLFCSGLVYRGAQPSARQGPI